jgi:hypothetical protein
MMLHREEMDRMVRRMSEMAAPAPAGGLSTRLKLIILQPYSVLLAPGAALVDVFKASLLFRF